MHEQANSYIFSSHTKQAEYERLCLIQDSFDDKSQAHLIKAGISAGMECLEVGVGAGSIAIWMRERVGDEGSVVGVDLDTDFMFEQGDIELIKGNILDLQIDKQFDLIHLRYVLIHNKKAKELIAKLYNLLKVGGKLLIEEPDFTLAKWIDAQGIEACKRVNLSICKMFENRGLKAHFGSTAHLSLEEAGFKIEERKTYLHLCSGQESVARVMESSAIALKEEYLKTGLCSNEDIEIYTKACEDLESLGVYYATIAITALKDEKSQGAETVRKEGFFRAQSDDEISQCFSLMHELRSTLDEETFLKRVKVQMQEGYHLVYLLHEAKIVALAGYRSASSLAWGRYIYIDDLVSTEKERSKGYGKKMMDYLIKHAKEQGFESLHLDSGVQRFQAHRFYLREKMQISSHHFSMQL